MRAISYDRWTIITTSIPGNRQKRYRNFLSYISCSTNTWSSCVGSFKRIGTVLIFVKMSGLVDIHRVVRMSARTLAGSRPEFEGIAQCDSRGVAAMEALARQRDSHVFIEPQLLGNNAIVS